MTTHLPSTSQNGDEISAEQFNRIFHERSVIVLDCRSNGDSVKKANRFFCSLRLPALLQRRLMGGSMRLATVPDLKELNNPPDQCPEVLLIPGDTEQDEQLSTALARNLKSNDYHHFVLGESVNSLLSQFPSLRDMADENWNTTFQMNSMPGQGVGQQQVSGGPLLNLNQLRLEGEDQGGKQRAEFPVKLTSFLYLGNAETAKNRDILNKHSISHVINVTSNLPNTFEDDPNMRYLRISADDNASHNLTKFFPEAISFIEDARRNGSACLVHCLAGISRSVTICLAYLMKTEMCTLDSAYEWVQKRNASIAPNFHFMGQLTDYEKMLGLNSNRVGTYPSSAPRSPSCAIEAATASQVGGLLTPPPTSCSASPQSSNHSAKSFH
ncbi:hypothetical protein L5515_011068 [Caenorhabditis briggsae]|uniref:protein-tyrosine-phosphatase n=1 Tax=Caenorhabditis briggsae TaxID=6238 RepID=A0AAE9ETW4_CAEBR|nr:hypothetical protein L5515_011068 [Caenorhabditis briggsae]